ncbi:MAG: aminotransferase class III-fold pyridoxal phosphate-dependent enzyme, partial [Albidovulum sp.]
MSDQTHLIGGVPAGRIADIRAREAEIYVQSRPKTRAALAGGSAAFLEGVPMLWMRDWPQPFAMLVEHAEGARITDIDGHEMDDFCLGDTGSMFGHSPAPVAKAIAEQAAKGLTYMLPTPDALDVGRLLQETFGPFRWQIATTATDANRFAIRVARAVTGRPKILFFAGCYHGAVDDAMGAV